MAKASEDVWVKHPVTGYGLKRVARKGQEIPAGYAGLVAADKIEAPTSAPAAGESTEDAGRYDEHSVEELKHAAKERGLEGYSGLKKAELIDLLEQDDEESDNA